MTIKAWVVPEGAVKLAVAWVQPFVDAVYVWIVLVLMTALLALRHCTSILKVNVSLDEGMFTRPENA